MNAILLPFLLLVPTQIPAPAKEDPGPALAKYARELLEAHNRERAEQKLAPLTLDDRLNKAAEVHARDMAQHSQMSHEGSDKSAPADRIKKQNYHYTLVGENVAAGQEDVKDVVKAWMDSPPHRENILGAFTQMGAAVYKDQEGRPFWAVDFGTPIPKLKPEEAAKDLLALINKEREEAKKPALAASSKLDRAAQNAAAEFARIKSIESRTSDPAKLVEQEKYRFRDIAESAAAGAPTPKDLLKSFLMNDEHKAQFLGDFKDVGIGYAQDDDETPYWCILFAKPRS